MLGLGGVGYGRAMAIAIAVVVIVALGIYPAPILGPIQTAAQHFISLGI